MSKRQVAVDGSASAADGYSPAGEAPPPATRLLDLPPALLDDIACRVMQLGPRSQLPLTCRAFSLARLLHTPALRIQLGRQCCDQQLTPRVVAALQARPSKLALTLWQPETEDSERYQKQLAPTLQLPQTEYTQDYTDLLTHALTKLDYCAAVEVCQLVSSGTYDRDKLKHLHCSPGLAQQLLDSFPNLTALTLQGLCVSSDALASLLSHPPLALQLPQLHLPDTSVMIGDEPGEICDEQEVVGPSFEGLQLKQLSIDVQIYYGTPLLPSFQPLAQHLTQLHLMNECDYGSDLCTFMMYIQPLAQLQVLTISHLNSMEGLTQLLQALPLLHTLQLPLCWLDSEQQLDSLLAATKLTSLQFKFVALDASRADAPCSWQQLELTGNAKGSDIAHLPLHSLSQPLVLGRLQISVHGISNPEVAEALHLVAQACKVPVMITKLELVLPSLEQQIAFDYDEERYVRVRSAPSVTLAFLQQQREDLVQLVALLQPLQCYSVSKVQVWSLHRVTAADIVALAPLCRDCTHFALYSGSVEPSLEFWRQLVQLMPTVTDVVFKRVEGSTSSAMHESLQLMAEQPWARWLDITIHKHHTAPQPPACWQAGGWLKTGIFKVAMWSGRSGDYYDLY
ncbi:hypothetical protein QJQ45_008989 [Haematococcus lacustris]|nr:hypothetical protein QJQ45_008989 [Haematococcus lacustris]